MSPRRGQRQSRATELLTDITTELRSGVGILSQLLGAPDRERAALREKLLGLEGASMDVHFNLMTHIRSVFLTPLPRQDIYMLSQQLNRTMEHVVASGDLIVARTHLKLAPQSHDQIETLGSQVDLTAAAMARLEDFDHLEDYWIQMQRLAKQANRTHRDWVTSTDGAFQPNIALQQSEIATAILSAAEAQRAVATTVGSIIVRES